MQHRNWPIFPWFFALLTTILTTTVQALQLMFWRFTWLLNVINHPRSIWHRLGGSCQREHHASPRRFGQICSGDVFRRLVGDRLKDLLPSLANRPLDLQAADACPFPYFFDHG